MTGLQITTVPGLVTSWTPTDASGAGLSLTINDAGYIKSGSQISIRSQITFPSTLSAAAVKIGGLPFAVNKYATGTFYGSNFTGIVRFNDGSNELLVFKADGTQPTNVNFSSGILILTGFYFI